MLSGMRDVYRTPGGSTRPAPAPEWEDRIVHIVLGAVGALGVAVGVADPSDALELSAGLVLVVLAAYGLLRRRA
jgi:MYXO-CTERM domain-containing protein